MEKHLASVHTALACNYTMVLASVVLENSMGRQKDMLVSLPQYIIIGIKGIPYREVRAKINLVSSTT